MACLDQGGLAKPAGYDLRLVSGGVSFQSRISSNHRIFTDQITEAKMLERIQEGVTCRCCHREIKIDDEILERCVRIERGDFYWGDHREDDNIKCDIFICKTCYLEDEDLCRFFNRIGMRVR